MGSVSRETTGGELPEPPPAAVEYFGDRLPAVEHYAEILAGRGIAQGLLGPREVPRLWDRHLLNCAVVQDAVPREAALVDVGSGAGLPGVVLAVVRPDLAVTLVEPLLRRSVFLRDVVAELRLPNVQVVRSRAEDLHGKLVADVVTARAVAPLDRLARWTLALLRPGGLLVALKGSSVRDELANAADSLETLGAVSWRVSAYGAGVVDPPTLAAVVVVGDQPQGRGDGLSKRRRS
ncbi:MAG TPA: 16S rRNA (guanine(527)-N(7))-methyltransferase RsmG [Jiangellaceae bacterium]